MKDNISSLRVLDHWRTLIPGEIAEGQQMGKNNNNREMQSKHRLPPQIVKRSTGGTPKFFADTPIPVGAPKKAFLRFVDCCKKKESPPLKEFSDYQPGAPLFSNTITSE